MKIVSFKQVNELHKKGINLCIGCKYERCASCTDDRLKVCNYQYKLKSKSNENNSESVSKG